MTWRDQQKKQTQLTREQEDNERNFARLREKRELEDKRAREDRDVADRYAAEDSRRVLDPFTGARARSSMGYGNSSSSPTTLD
ncbi:hypothetical protein RvY_16030 [Ramazzottius varieornatus]|uniref:Uncharacterized protein n=1 Tax=Ramazzottius varieornatus TaxID=947166 RepID=A0A1D1VYF6_RAMVA|nr:hypothetical protein RvY_16030 [Ramazzottius varieornatus]